MGRRRETLSQGADCKREESTNSRVHRMRYPPCKAICWGHIHSGGEVAYKLTLRIRGPEYKQPTKREKVKT
jgi:hypothetical protein